jgi:hypothetical protein
VYGIDNNIEIAGKVKVVKHGVYSTVVSDRGRGRLFACIFGRGRLSIYR